MADWDEFLQLNQELLKNVITSNRKEVETMEIVYLHKKSRKYHFEFLRNMPKVTMKIEVSAKKYRVKANELFNANPPNVYGAIELYTKSICCASSETPELGLAHANRGLALMKVNRFTEAYWDCQEAVTAGYPTKKLIKVLLRQATCSAQLKMADRLETDLKTIENHATVYPLNSKDQEIYVELQEKLKNIKGANCEQSLSESNITPNKMTLLHHPRKGRYTVAASKLSENELIFSEKAFAFIPVYEGRGIISFDCQNCASVNIIPFVCETCKLASYCSPDCRQQHFNIHRLECPGYTINLWAKIGIAHLVTRTFILGLEQIYASCAGKTFENAGVAFEYISAFFEKNDNLTYAKVFGLVTNFDKMILENYACYVVTSQLLTVYFKMFTELFDSAELKTMLPSSQSQEVFLGAVILRHIGQLVSNGHAITNIRTTLPSIENCYNSENEVAKGKLHIFLRITRAFTAIFPNICMLNHSCDPNIRNKMDGDLLTVYANRSIPANGEIFNCYGPHFQQQDPVERQHSLKQQYLFDCDCSKCEADDDGGANFQNYSQFLCQNSKCRKKIYVANIESFNEYNKQVKCENCGRVLNLQFAKTLEKYLKDEYWNEFLSLYKDCTKHLNRASDYNLNFLFTTLIHFLPESATNIQLHNYLVGLAIELLNIRRELFGICSMEFAKDSVFLLDLLALRFVDDAIVNENLVSIRKSLGILTTSIRKVYEDYMENYLHYKE